jgi:hypothetical protein
VPDPIPPEALTLAAVAIHDAECPDRTCSGPALGHCYRLARVALEAASPVLIAAEVSARVAEQHAVHADLALLLRVLGLGDHARPKSSHEVMLDAINEAGRLKQIIENWDREIDQLRNQLAARPEVST